MLSCPLVTEKEKPDVITPPSNLPKTDFCIILNMHWNKTGLWKLADTQKKVQQSFRAKNEIIIFERLLAYGEQL